MLRQPFGKRAAALHGIAQLGNGRLEYRIALLLFEHHQAAQQRQSRVDQRRQLPGENHQDLRLDRFVRRVALLARCRRGFRSRLGHDAPPPFLAVFVAGAASLSLLVHAGGKITRLPQLADGVVGVLRFDQPDGLLSAGVQGNVIEFRHGSGGGSDSLRCE